MKKYDAVIIGAGPNGLAASIVLALKGLSVVVFEAKATIGGGCRSEELTLPGYIHDVCSSIHPLAIGSPFLRTLPLSNYGLEWVHPAAPLAHPFEDGTSILLERSLDKTCEALGEDAAAYRQLLGSFVEKWDQLEDSLLGPLSFPHHPFLLLQFAMKGLPSMEHLVKKHFKERKTKGLFGGLAAHSILPLDQPITSAVGLVLGILGHVFGWPMPRGGSQAIVDALGAYFQYLGGNIENGVEVSSLDELPPAQAVLFDLTPRQILRLAESQLSSRYKRQLRNYRYGPGVFKMDWALDAPIPWTSEGCHRAGTVHLGDTLEEVAASERGVWRGVHSQKPFVILAQHSLFDATRAPPGHHTAWAYCHVPPGSTVDMTERIENQIERFAPNFRRSILARSTKNTEEMENYNPNYIGGDIIGGVQDIWQLLTRPVKRLVPYATSNPRLFICSSSTPPGGGVHGMCGYHAAKAVLRRVFGIK